MSPAKSSASVGRNARAEGPSIEPKRTESGSEAQVNDAHGTSNMEHGDGGGVNAGLGGRETQQSPGPSAANRGQGTAKAESRLSRAASLRSIYGRAEHRPAREKTRRARRDSPAAARARPQAAGPPPRARRSASPSGKEYEVGLIVDDRLDRNTYVHRYLIQWKGYDASHNTWEPKRNLSECWVMIKEYEARKKRQKRDHN